MKDGVSALKGAPSLGLHDWQNPVANISPCSSGLIRKTKITASNKPMLEALSAFVKKNRRLIA